MYLHTYDGSWLTTQRQFYHYSCMHITYCTYCVTYCMLLHTHAMHMYKDVLVSNDGTTYSCTHAMHVCINMPACIDWRYYTHSHNVPRRIPRLCAMKPPSSRRRCFLLHIYTWYFSCLQLLFFNTQVTQMSSSDTLDSLDSSTFVTKTYTYDWHVLRLQQPNLRL